MDTRETIQALARLDLVITDDQGHQELFLWEHSQRVAHCAVEGVPALIGAEADGLDLLALGAAAWYHDVGWAIQCRQGLIPPVDLCNRSTTPTQRELAAELMRSRLADALPADKLDAACQCVLELAERTPSSLPAKVLADADKLDQMGPLLYWRILRRHALDGRGLQGAIETWQTNKQYRFYEAQIEATHFDPVRELARQRLGEFDHFMEQLARQHCCKDVDNFRPARA